MCYVLLAYLLTLLNDAVQVSDVPNDTVGRAGYVAPWTRRVSVRRNRTVRVQEQSDITVVERARSVALTVTGTATIVIYIELLVSPADTCESTDAPQPAQPRLLPVIIHNNNNNNNNNNNVCFFNFCF